MKRRSSSTKVRCVSPSKKSSEDSTFIYNYTVYEEYYFLFLFFGHAIGDVLPNELEILY